MTGLRPVSPSPSPALPEHRGGRQSAAETSVAWWRVVLPLLSVLVLSACASDPIPEVTYFRLPPPAPVQSRTVAALDEPIVVDVFLADGLHGEQAILYQTSPGSGIKAYHYQLWNDPPVRMLQRRLIRRLRDAGVSALVTDRLSTNLNAVRISAVLESFERVRNGEGWDVSVGLEMRVDRGDAPLPQLLKSYSATVPAESATIQAAVRAFAVAVDQVFGEFTHDLAAPPA